MRRFRRTPRRPGWQTSRVGIKSGATGLDDEPVRRPRLPRRDELSGLPLLIEAPLAIGLDDQRKRGMSPTRTESHYRIEARLSGKSDRRRCGREAKPWRAF